MGTEPCQRSIPVDLQRSHPWEPILPAAPLLSSQSAGWTALHLEHHRQPAHATPDYSLPHHTIVVCLDYQAREFGVSGRTYRHLMNGNVTRHIRLVGAVAGVRLPLPPDFRHWIYVVT